MGLENLQKARAQLIVKKELVEVKEVVGAKL